MASRKRDFGSNENEARFTAVVAAALAALTAAKDEWEKAQTTAEETKKPDDVLEALRMAREVYKAQGAYNEACEALDQVRAESGPVCAPPDLKRARMEDAEPKDHTLDKALEAASASADDSAHTPRRSVTFTEMAPLTPNKGHYAVARAADDDAAVSREFDLSAAPASAPAALPDAANTYDFTRSGRFSKETGSILRKFFDGRREGRTAARKRGASGGYYPIIADDELDFVILGHRSVVAATRPTAAEFYKKALGDAYGKPVRVVIRGGSNWDKYDPTGGDTDTVTVAIDPTRHVNAFLFLAEALDKVNDASWWSRAPNYMTHDEGMLYYLLLEAKTVDILALCSDLYQNKDVARPLANAFAYLLRWAQAEAHRATVTCSDWAAKFLSKHFAEMTGVNLGFKIVCARNSRRDVLCVGDRDKALTCPLTALSAAAGCVKAGEALELTIHELDGATKPEIDADTEAANCTTETYLETKHSGEMAVWTTTFLPSAGAKAPLTMVWSTKHFCEVRSVRNIDREQSATLARATFPGAKGEATATQILEADDDSVADTAALLIQSQAPGSAKKQQASPAPQSPTTNKNYRPGYDDITPACSPPDSPTSPGYAPTAPHNAQYDDTPACSPPDSPTSLDPDQFASELLAKLHDVAGRED